MRSKKDIAITAILLTVLAPIVTLVSYQNIKVMAAGCYVASSWFTFMCPMYEVFVEHPFIYGAALWVLAFLYLVVFRSGK